MIVFKYLSPILLAVVSLFVQAQSEKKVLGEEDIAGKTFHTLGQFGPTVQYYRTDGTFKACGDSRFWCDEGTWSFIDGKINRKYQSWNNPNPAQVTQEGEKISFGGSSTWLIFPEGTKLPPGVVSDPRR